MKNYRFYVLLLIIVLNILSLKAQSVLEGTIFDSITGLPIEGVNIIVKDTDNGSYTDLDGYYEIQIVSFPATLIISHLGYTDKELKFINADPKTSQIFLEPLYNALEEITVRPVDDVESISNVDKYSIIDFEVVNESILRLELRGANTYMLTMTDLSGKENANLKLEKNKRVERLFKSCTDNLFLVCSNYAIQLFVSESGIDLGQSIKIDTFNDFIETCKLRIRNKVYYQMELHNGLQQDISSYDLESKKVNLFKSIANQTQLKHYFEDSGIIKSSQIASNITTNNVSENKRIRKLQQNGDFYLTVLHKPEFPIYLGETDGYMVLFNHIEGKLQKYDINDLIQSETLINYTIEEDWLKIILLDQVTKKAFAVYNHDKGLAIKEIDLQSGATDLKAIINAKYIQYQNMIMHNGFLFYLKKENKIAINQELMKYSIN